VLICGISRTDGNDLGLVSQQIYKGGWDDVAGDEEMRQESDKKTVKDQLLEASVKAKLLHKTRGYCRSSPWQRTAIRNVYP
jgi:hypothetical protein